MTYGSFFLLVCSAVASAQPNIVLIVGDDMCPREFGFMGSAQCKTPTLDWLATQGTVFTDCQLPQSVCRPTVASIMTGRQPHEHGILSHHESYPNLAAGSTFLQPLRAAGYRTRVDGPKWWNTPQSGHADEWGYTTYVGPHPTEPYMYLSDYWRKGIAGSTDFISRCSAANTPFALVCVPLSPHMPHEPPQDQLDLFSPASIFVPSYATTYADEYTAAHHKYLAMTSWFDSWVGSLIWHLRIMGQLDNTLIVFLADNGYDSGRCAKNSPYDAGHRTPLIFVGANVQPQRIDSLVEARDVVPTILDYADVEIPASVSGTSRLGDLTGEPTAKPEYVFGFHQGQLTTIPGAVRAKRNDGYEYICWLTLGVGAGNELFSVTGTVPAKQTGQQELYHVPTDPDEQVNLIDTQPAIATAMRAATEAWWTDLGYDPLPSVSAPITYAIVDDADANFGVAGNWMQGLSGRNGANHVSNQNMSQYGPGAAAFWSVSVSPGLYCVSATWTSHSNRATNSPFTVFDGTLDRGTVLVNQELPPDDLDDSGSWFENLGNYQCDSGSLIVRLTNSANEYVIADAIRVEKLD